MLSEPAAAIAVALALLRIFPHPAAAEDQTLTVPISVDRCTMSERARIENPEHAGPHESVADELTIVYRNERDVAAIEVHFQVRYSGHRLDLIDRGTIAPHAKLTHAFNQFTLTFAGSPASCSVAAVLFTDGSRWDAPSESPSPEPKNR